MNIKDAYLTDEEREAFTYYNGDYVPNPQTNDVDLADAATEKAVRWCIQQMDWITAEAIEDMLNAVAPETDVEGGRIV